LLGSGGTAGTGDQNVDVATDLRAATVFRVAALRAALSCSAMTRMVMVRSP
jgi:hypothetical protein